MDTWWILQGIASITKHGKRHKQCKQQQKLNQIPHAQSAQFSQTLPVNSDNWSLSQLPGQPRPTIIQLTAALLQSSFGAFIVFDANITIPAAPSNLVDMIWIWMDLV